MNKELWYIEEYQNLRNELNYRIKFLHETIIFWVIFLIASLLMIVFGVKKSILHTFLLFIPVVLDMLAFNYQSNQNSLESISKYYHEYLKPKLEKKHEPGILGWEYFFAHQKEPFRVESVTKIFPFVLPSLIPLYLIFTQTHLEKYQIVMVVIDLILLIIMVENFRYKLRRIKVPKNKH